MGKFLLSTLLLLTTVLASTAANPIDIISTETISDFKTKTSYTTWTNQTYSSSAKYTFKVNRSYTKADSYYGIQFGYNTDSGKGAYHSGFIVTESGGSSANVTIKWASKCTAGRTLNIYESDNAYNSLDELFADGLKATTTLTSSNSGESSFTTKKPYFAFRVASYAIEISSITVEWIPSNKCATPVAMINGEPVANGGKAVVGDELSFSCSTEDATITYTITGGNFTGESKPYDGTPIKLDKISVYTITAKATKDGMDASDELKINNLDVVGKTPQMSFANASVYGKVNTGVVWQQVIIKEANESIKKEDIEYSSSDSSIVSIDAVSGQIKPADVKKAGIATITAKIPARGNYTKGSASYLIVVIDPNATIEPTSTVFDFTTENPYKMTTQSGNNAPYERDMPNPVTSIPGDNKTVTIDFTGRYRSWKASNTYELRVEKFTDKDNPMGELTISVPEGYRITKIGITGAAVNPKYNPASGETSSDPDFKSVWIPQSTDGKFNSVNKVTIQADPTQLKISKINVMWDAADSELKPVQLTFTPNVNGIYVDKIAEINAVNNPNNRTIEYKIPALAEDEYDIEVVDNNKLHVLVSKPGSYTLEARSVGGDGFRDGFAIMRLNVYRHLAVYANEVALEEDVINTTSGDTDVTIDVPENANLYYRFENTTTPETVAENESDNENRLEGYTPYEDVITVPAKTAGTLSFYIANYGYLSPIRKITLSFETGVEEIENAANGVVRIFDLNGREIKGTPEKGVYIRIQNGKATKVVI